MPERMAFSRKLKELIAGEDQIDVAVRLGYSQSRISQICRGERPSRQFVEKLIEAYNLPREEWLEAGGFGPKTQGPDPMMEDMARLAATEALAQMHKAGLLQSAGDILLEGWEALCLAHPRLDIPFPSPQGGIRNLTADGARSILRSIEARIERGGYPEKIQKD